VGGNPPVGVLALQGDFAMHVQALERIGARTVEVRTVRDLERAERLIMPGGESTTVSRLLAFEGLDVAILRRAERGMRIWGTCMGLILLAKRVTNRPVSPLGLLDVTVERNAYGRQLDSFEANFEFRPTGEIIRGVFIRAPVIREAGPGVEVLAVHEDTPVAVRTKTLLGTTFHPELTSDPTIHAYFLGM
jgi:5'-phosphate synthase pdxT subunit